MNCESEGSSDREVSIVACVVHGSTRAMSSRGTPSTCSPCLERRVLHQAVVSSQLFQAFAVFLCSFEAGLLLGILGVGLRASGMSVDLLPAQ